MSKSEISLKEIREKQVKKTQEQVAEYMDVSITTIQNWEGEYCQIKKEQLHKLLDFYGVTPKERRDIVLQIYGNGSCIDTEEDEEDVNEFLFLICNGISCYSNPDRINEYNFPDFLFKDNPEIIKAAKEITLSAEEMDIFGYWYHNQYEYPKIPYSSDFYESHGGYFKTMKKLKKIELMFKGMDNKEIKTSSQYTFLSIIEDIYNFGILYPNRPYSYCSASKYYVTSTLHTLPCDIPLTELEDINRLYDDCRRVKDPLMIGTSLQPDRKYEFVKDFVVLKENDSNCDYRLKQYRICKDCIGEQCDSFRKCSIYERCFQIKKQEFTDESYLKDKKEYEEALNEYKKHPSLYDHAPDNFTPQYEYWLSLTDLGKQYVTWMEEDYEN